MYSTFATHNLRLNHVLNFQYDNYYEIGDDCFYDYLTLDGDQYCSDDVIGTSVNAANPGSLTVGFVSDSGYDYEGVDIVISDLQS